MNKYDVDNLLNQILLDVGAGVGIAEEDRAISLIMNAYDQYVLSHYYSMKGDNYSSSVREKNGDGEIAQFGEKLHPTDQDFVSRYVRQWAFLRAMNDARYIKGV